MSCRSDERSSHLPVLSSPTVAPPGPCHSLCCTTGRGLLKNITMRCSVMARNQVCVPILVMPGQYICDFRFRPIDLYRPLSLLLPALSLFGVVPELKEMRSSDCDTATVPVKDLRRDDLHSKHHVRIFAHAVTLFPGLCIPYFSSTSHLGSPLLRRPWLNAFYVRLLQHTGV